jgi:diguanylate cyclase (GGDEF)-like protein/PAS domain S-box-containing protein
LITPVARLFSISNAYRDSLRRLLTLAVAPLLIVLLLAISLPGIVDPLLVLAEGYLVFHILAESVAILAALLIFVVGWHAAKRGAALSVLVLACAFMGVGMLDFLHTLTYDGMPVILGLDDPQQSIYLWLAARLLAAAGLLAALLLKWERKSRETERWAVLGGVLLLVMLVSYAVFSGSINLPDVYDPATGLTALKTALEATVLALHLIVAALLFLRLSDVQPYHGVAMLGANLIMAMASVWFIMYSNLTDGYVVAGHAYKVLAYLFLFRAIFSEAIEWPYIQVQESERKLQATLDAVPDLMFGISADGSYHYAHSSDPRLPQQELDKLLGTNIWDFLGEPAAKVFLDGLREAARQGYSRGRQFCVTLPGGKAWYELSVSRKADQPGEQSEFVALCRDISDRKQVETQLRLAAAAFETQVAIMVTDANQTILKVNEAFSRITGYSSEEVIGKTPKVLSSGMQDAGFYRAMYAQLEAEDQWEGEMWNRRKNGEVYPEHLNISIVRDTDGNIEYYVANFGDLTLAKQAEERIHTLAYYDSLTNLPNRRMLLDHITRAQNKAERAGGNTFWALLFIDLDNFKTLNDSQGHSLGDLMLRRAAERIKACTRSKDIVARPGGDEFAILLNGLSHDLTQAAKAAQEVADKVLEQVSKPYFLNGFTYITTASVGVTVFNGEQFSNDELLGQSELAMYRAKERGGNNFSFFVPEMHQAAIERSHLETDLRSALDKNQLVLFFQPKVDGNADIQGFEVLLRWRHPQRGIVSPADFIPIAEATGLIVPIGEWVLKETCRLLREWLTDQEHSHWRLAVNISERQLSHERFVESVRSILEEHDFDYELTRKLEFEITESMLMKNIEQTVAVIRELNTMGIKFAMDDFGTGYSSLNYLKMLPLDCVKVDQSFVRDMRDDQSDAAIVEMVIALAKSMQLVVVAEGVETYEQHRLLVGLGCDQMQGYYYGKPAPLEQIASQSTLQAVAF